MTNTAPKGARCVARLHGLMCLVAVLTACGKTGTQPRRQAPVDEVALAPRPASSAASPEGERPETDPAPTPTSGADPTEVAASAAVTPTEPPPPLDLAAGRAVYAAKHLVVQWAGAKRSTQTRTKAEARARAEEALIKIRNGADFETTAKAYSDEPSVHNTGGNLGRFQRANVVRAFGDTVAALSVGEMSGIVETEFGFHVVLRTE
jgi:hypothetical protein